MRVSLESLLFLVGVLATTVAAIVAAMWMARRRRDQELRQPGSPLLVMPVAAPAPALFARSAPGEVHSQRRTPPRTPNEVVIPFSGPVTAVDDAVTATTGRFAPGSPAPEVVHGHSLRFHRPSDGTLQFLPGSLEVIGGPDAGHEVRFVRPDPGEAPDVTFGRRDGPPYRHVQLLEPTVSRTHARLVLDGEGWRVVNLSRTNPIVVNSEAIHGVDGSVALKDGDLVEMGALVFRYHHPESAARGGQA